MADYLEAYAERFRLPVQTGVSVDAIAKNGGGYVVTAGDRRIEADHVVVASGTFASPIVPDLAAELDPRITQLHSADYRNPSQLQEGAVLVVGASHSGGDIAFEVARTYPTLVSGTQAGFRSRSPGTTDGPSRCAASRRRHPACTSSACRSCKGSRRCSSRAWVATPSSSPTTSPRGSRRRAPAVAVRRVHRPEANNRPDAELRSMVTGNARSPQRAGRGLPVPFACPSRCRRRAHRRESLRAPRGHRCRHLHR
jgi:cation diffusion facilitator CzcD-associated flavoprotein CzcO